MYPASAMLTVECVVAGCVVSVSNGIRNTDGTSATLSKMGWRALGFRCLCAVYVKCMKLCLRSIQAGAEAAAEAEAPPA